jgi:hypothetical protein
MHYKIRGILKGNPIWSNYLQNGGLSNPITQTLKTNFDGEEFEITYNKEDDIREFYLKGLKNKCFFFVIEKNGFAVIHGLGNQPDCIKKKHQYKTSHLMFILILKILFSRNVKRIEFQDNSMIKNYDLADLYFLKYGETWYDKMFRTYIKKYNMEFNKRSFPIEGKGYQDLKKHHKEFIGNKFKNLDFKDLKSKRDCYFEALGIRRLSEISYSVDIIEWS